MLGLTCCSNAWVDLWSAFTYLKDGIISEKSSGAAVGFYLMGARQCTGKWMWSNPDNGHAKPLPGTPRIYLRKEVIEAESKRSEEKTKFGKKKTAYPFMRAELICYNELDNLAVNQLSAAWGHYLLKRKVKTERAVKKHRFEFLFRQIGR